MKPEKKEKQPRKWYAVENTKDISERDTTAFFNTLQEAYNEELIANGEGKKYAFLVTFLGEVKNELKIIK